MCEFTVAIVRILWTDFNILGQGDVQVLQVGHMKPACNVVYHPNRGAKPQNWTFQANGW